MAKAENKFQKYEIARLLGARALQISMGAPFLIKLSEKELEELHYDPLSIAELELKEGVLPINIRRPLPRSSVVKEEQAEQGGSS